MSRKKKRKKKDDVFGEELKTIRKGMLAVAGTQVAVSTMLGVGTLTKDIIRNKT